MLTLTPQAADAIRDAALRSNADGMYVRITARAIDGGGVVHGIGFDGWRDGDVVLDCEGIPIVVANSQRSLLRGLVLDFVQLNSGMTRFVYHNPNDVSCSNALLVCGGCADDCHAGHRLVPEATVGA